MPVLNFSQLIALISSRARNRQPKAHPPITAHLRCGTWATPPESDPLSDWWMWQRLIRPTRDKIRRIENLRIPIPTEAETQTKGNTGRFEQSSWGQTDVPYSWWDDVAETKRNVELSPDQQLTGNQIWCSDLRHVCRGTWPKRKTVEGLQLWLMIHSIIDHFNIFTLIFSPIFELNWAINHRWRPKTLLGGSFEDKDGDVLCRGGGLWSWLLEQTTPKS